jgi:hypothetical protein
MSTPCADPNCMDATHTRCAAGEPSRLVPAPAGLGIARAHTHSQRPIHVEGYLR